MRSALLSATLPFVLATGLGVAGCKGNPLDGRWRVASVDGRSLGGAAIYEFRNGRATFSYRSNLPGIGETTIVIGRSFAIEGRDLRLGSPSVAFSDTKLAPVQRASLNSPERKRFIASLIASMSERLAKRDVFALRFDSPDRVHLTDAREETILTRVE